MNDINKEKIYTIIQGNTKYCDLILKINGNEENIIWVTDTDCSAEDLKKIEKSKIKLITVDKIYPKGFHFSNWETNTTVTGLKYAKSLGAEYCIKTRAEIVCDNWTKFKEKMKFTNKLHSLYYAQYDKKLNDPYFQYFSHNYDYSASEQYHYDWLKTNSYDKILKNPYDWSYVCDFVVYGKTDEMLMFWDMPYEPDNVFIPVEHKYVFNYFKNKGVKDVELNWNFISKYFEFFIHELEKNDIKMHFLKYQYEISQGLTCDEKRLKKYCSLKEYAINY